MSRFNGKDRGFESYNAWRQRFPFSDEAIAVALEEYIANCTLNESALKYWQFRVERTRAGFVSRAAIAYALPFLVKVCGLCGKKALYRFGTQGRCKAHRMDAPSFFTEKNDRINKKQVVVSANLDDADRQAKTQERLQNRKLALRRR